MSDPPTYRDGRYVVVRPLGEGSQGETFEAVDKREGRLVALKRFRVATAKAWKDVELAEREALTLASIDHTLLPRYVEHFEEGGSLVLVMQHIEGESLAVVKRRGPSSVADVRRMLDDVSRALGYLHGLVPPVVHRDIKPANVIRRKDGSHALVDFGAVRARLKPEGGSTVVGTFGYMAPEQFQGRAAPASDVYGAAATAVAMLTGREPEELPHKGLAIDVAMALPSSVPPLLVRALEAMLEPDPEKRAGSIPEAFERARSVEERPPSKKPTSGRDARRAADRAARAEKHARRQERRDLRRKRRRRRGGLPLLPRLVASIGLLVAWVAVWITVGVVVPIVLYTLSILFGGKLRRAAAACARSAHRAGAAIWRASAALGGKLEEEGVPAHEDAERVRIGEEVLSRVRAVTPQEAQEEAMRRAERGGEDAEAWADEVATREAEKWREPEAWQKSEPPKRR